MMQTSSSPCAERRAAWAGEQICSSTIARSPLRTGDARPRTIHDQAGHRVCRWRGIADVAAEGRSVLDLKAADQLDAIVQACVIALYGRMVCKAGGADGRIRFQGRLPLTR